MTIKKTCPPGYTNIVNAREEFDPEFRAALKALDLTAAIQRRRVWIEGTEAHYFDLAREKNLVRFRAFKAGVIIRAASRGQA